MSLDYNSIAIAAIVSSALGVVVGYLVPKLSKQKTKYTPENAVELLMLEKPDVWNEVRFTNRNWKPVIKNLDAKNLSLQSVNFDDATLIGCDFEHTNLEAASFRGSELVNVNFSSANLKDAVFDNSVLDAVKLDRANSKNTDFSGIEATILQDAGLAISKEVLDKEAERIEDLSPGEFENLVIKLFESFGYSSVSPDSNRDYGYDIMLHPNDPVLGDNIYLLEAKRYSSERKVSASVVRELIGATVMKNAKGGVLVTNSSFTAEAIRAAEQYGNLRLIDGAKLRELITDFNRKTNPNNRIQQTQ